VRKQQTETGAANCANENSDDAWVLVEEGLFGYPLKSGEQPYLLGNHCTGCKRYFFPKRAICPHCCGNGTMESVELGRQGIIYSCTVVHRDSPVGIKAPYAYGYVQIPENNLRVFALLTGKEATSFAPGEAVDLVVEPIRTDGAGRNVVGYKFRARA
jgi:uncharacterized OB-fold protein